MWVKVYLKRSHISFFRSSDDGISRMASFCSLFRSPLTPNTDLHIKVLQLYSRLINYLDVRSPIYYNKTDDVKPHIRIRERAIWFFEDGVRRTGLDKFRYRRYARHVRWAAVRPWRGYHESRKAWLPKFLLPALLFFAFKFSLKLFTHFWCTMSLRTL